jgi:Tol biopolymer transport system component
MPTATPPATPTRQRTHPAHHIVPPLLALTAVLAGCADDTTTSDWAGPRAPQTRIAAGDQQVVYTAGDGTGADAEAYHLWLMTETGTDPVQLTYGDGAAAGAVWSPDGTRIAFLAGPDPEANFDLWVIGADGTGLRQLTDTDDVNEGQPSWSPDGTRLAYAHTDQSDIGRIRILDLDDTDAEPRTVAGPGDWPSWSPDGVTILYSGDDDGVARLFTVPADGSSDTSEPTPLEPDGPSGAGEGSWSPDGSRIAFVASSGDPDAADSVDWNEDVWVMDADGSNARQVVTTPGNDHWLPTWSPDGQHLMYTADGTTNDGEIARVDLATLEVTVLTDNDVEDLMPSWRAVD